ncbi:thyroid adenoma-associated protein homolog [Anneissia japonica]|uniref:thyroid adenoma-associated protein homolog n=1 Tax=Anneissia japonica TaxID=1529436 RepID=UPI0014259807|nr:thyroid adenoma-associated protein homolog [Anneissia japonica]
MVQLQVMIKDSPSSCINWQSFNEFLQEENELQQVSLLKKFGSGLRKLVCPGFEESHLEDLIGILADIHINAQARCVLRRTIVRYRRLDRGSSCFCVLQSLPDTLHGCIIKSLQTALTNHIASCDQSDQSSCRVRIDTLQSLMENFSLGEAALKATLHPVIAILEDVLHSIVARIRDNTEKTAVGLSEMMHHCLAIVKTTRVLVRKCYSELRDEVTNIDSKMRSRIQNIRNDACHILKDGLFFADCQNAAGMILIQIMLLLADQKLPAKEIADELCIETQKSTVIIEFHYLPPLSKLFVCQGVLATVPKDQLTRHLVGDVSLLEMMFQQIWCLVSVLMESFSALSVARAFALWTTCAISYVETEVDDLNALKAFTGYQDIPQKLLEYSWTNWDHPIDCMRHQVNSIFGNIIKLHRKSAGYSGNADYNDDAFICDVLQKILSSDHHVRGKYSFLACMVDNIGAELILKRNPTLPTELYICIMDQNLSPCVGNLVDVMAKDHLKQMIDSSSDDWHFTWIDSLLHALHTCPPIQHKSYIMQVTLPKLMKCNPSSVQYIIETLQSSKWEHLDVQGIKSPDVKLSKPMVPQIISPLDTQGMMPLDVRETDLLNAEKKRPENVQGMRPLDTQGSKHINAQSSKPLDMQGSWPLDAQASKSLDYKGMRLCMLMTCLKTARASNITITEFEDDEQGDKMWHGLVGRTTIRQALCHKNNQVRLDTFALICDTKKTAEVLTDCDFDLIKFFLPYNLSSPLPSFRQQLMMLIKKLLIRLQDSGRLHYKNSKTTNCPSQSEAANRIHAYKGFLDWFVELLFSGLQSGSCYSTRVSSLSALSILSKFQSDTFALICDTKKTAEVLTDCDFDLIKFFLPYNLSSHLPSFRQQLMMLIKKMCIRDRGNLVDVMAKDHLKQMIDSSSDDWHFTWIDSLLHALHTCPPIQHKSYIMQVTLPKLMKCNPSSVQYIIETLQSSKWEHLDVQGIKSPDVKLSKSMVPQIISPLDTQGMMPLDVRETDLLNAEKKRPENVQGMRPLDTQGSKHINAQSSKPLDIQGSWPLDAQASKSLDYKGMRLCMLMTCLKTARASNITITEFEDDEQGDEMWHGLVGRTTIKQALCHKNNQVRLDTFALICDTKKTAEVLTDCDFDLIKFFLPYNLSSDLPSFRQQLMMLIKKLLIRLQDSGRLHYKNSKTTNCPSQSEAANRIHAYKGFLDWFVELLFSGLQSGSCYSTRVSSLSALSILSKFQSGCSWYGDSIIFSPKNVKLLLRCFTDPYESNKVMAFNLLVPLTQKQLGMQDLGRLNTLYKVAIELGCSTRPHNCETASFMLRFLSRQLEPAIKHSSSYHDNLQGIVGDMLNSLSEQVEVANRRLIEAAGTRPMYGVLHCVRELIEDVNFHELTVSVTAKYKQLIDKLLLMCYQVAEVVSPVVCNSSPEGYHPANQERDGSDVPQIDDVAAVEPTFGSNVLNVTPQALLVCCWRSMKEVSLTLGKISQQHEKSQTLLSQQQSICYGPFELHGLSNPT